MPAAMNPNEPVRHDLGVLFVHGIGQQVRGGTLVQFGDPICEWLSRWSGSEFILENCDLNPGDGTPARAQVRCGDANWMLAECHWADAFHEPSFQNLMKWAFVGIPWVLGAHFNSQIILGRLCWKHARYWNAVGRFVRAIGSSLVGAMLVALVAALFPILFAFAVIPVLRSAVVSLQRLFAAVLGDSYLFVESHVQQAAIVSHFRRDLSWLLERSERVAVIAHSRGAAVAYFGCKGWVPDSPASPITLLTFGSGLSKLQVLRGARAFRHEEEHGGVFAWIAPSGLILLAGFAHVLPGASWGGLGLALLLLLFGLLCLLAGSPRSGALLTDSDKRGSSAIARFGATALLLWPIFAGMTHFRLHAALVQGWHLPMVSADPPQFWMGILVGLPIWLCFWGFGEAAVRHFRVSSASGPRISPPVPDGASKTRDSRGE